MENMKPVNNPVKSRHNNHDYKYNLNHTNIEDNNQ